MADLLARNYAQALYLATKHSPVLLERVVPEFEHFVEMNILYPDLVDYFDSRIVDHETENRFMAALIKALRFSEEIHGFMRAVIKHNRFHHLPVIFEAFVEILEKENAREEAVPA